MKQIYHFERQAPPVLTEATLRAELERREKRQRTILLALASILFQIAEFLFAALFAEMYPLLSLLCIIHIIVSAAGSGTIAVVYSQKEVCQHE